MLENILNKSKIIKEIKKIDYATVYNNLDNTEEIRDAVRIGSEYIDAYDITYEVDGLNIKGFIAIPKSVNLNKKNKTAIYLRGGNNLGKSFGEIRVGAIVNKNAFASYLPHMGYITFYTQYRGINNQGVDEFGGADINDVIELFEIIKQLDFCNSEKIIMMGHSRGGTMIYRTMTYDLPIYKAIVIAGTSDRARSVIDGWREGWREYVGKFFDINNTEELYKRSAVQFYKEMKCIPILIVHGNADENVNIQDSIDINKLLPNSKLIIYNDDHNITANRDNLKEEIEKFLAE